MTEPSERPRTWKEARTALQTLLEEYMQSTNLPLAFREQETPPAFSKDVAAIDESRHTRWSSVLCRLWTQWDLDLYIGSFGGTAFLVVVSALALYGTEKTEEAWNLQSSQRLQRSQFAASLMLFVGAIVSIWMLRRRTQSSTRGNQGLKRREVAKFLQAFKEQVDTCENGSPDAYPVEDNGISLSGSALSDIYPVHRLETVDGQVTKGSWCKLPSLLLVQGDYIALQVGDVAPAACRPIEGDLPRSFRLARGERVTLATLGLEIKGLLRSLPQAKSTLSKESNELLKLCHNTQIFVVEESPLKPFLEEKRDIFSKTPLSHRQLGVIRMVASSLAVVFLALSCTVLFSRIDWEQMDLSMLVNIPVLACLGMLPLVVPACLVFIEILGTARVLVAYHPVASKQDGETLVIESQAQLDWLLLRYVAATTCDRLALPALFESISERIVSMLDKKQSTGFGHSLVQIPPASLFLLEKLGVATAFTVVDDDMVCEPQAIPQQLLIPSGKGLKLLDICPTYDDESLSNGSDSDQSHNRRSLEHVEEGDSESDSDEGFQQHTMPNTRKRLRQLRKRYNKQPQDPRSPLDERDDEEDEATEVQFEDPNWWQFLPSLKCIGLASLLVDERIAPRKPELRHSTSETSVVRFAFDLRDCKRALCRGICSERQSSQLRSLAQCIGFSTKQNENGPRGDMSFYKTRFRLHVVSAAMFSDRLGMDTHELGSEQAKWWGLLRPDATSVIVEDRRSGGFQLVTIGDPRVVTRFCQESWQGEISQLTPLGSLDRKTILETSTDWKLSDLDVEAFSYSPVPYTFESRCSGDKVFQFYLYDNDLDERVLPNLKDKSATGEWPFLHNQVFLGMLGSLVVPRDEVQGLLSTFQDSGVRFVYFSPRNMRRQKEIASQMGIDVAWNCAISLRSLDDGQEDPHRMVSNYQPYADWDVNAKLPHGIESVRRHLVDVDNVPLLVSLFTDVTKETTMQMIEIFQEYHDTVLSVGMSHLPQNAHIFATADLAIGVDDLSTSIPKELPVQLQYNALLPCEISFASSISSYACVFHLKGVVSTEYIPAMIAQGRAALEAATASAVYLAVGCLSFTLYVVFATFAVSIWIPFVPLLGAVVHLQILLPLLCLSMTMTDPDRKSMNRVPPKNDASITFGRREGKVLYLSILMKSLPPAVLPQILHPMVAGELMLKFDPQRVEEACGVVTEESNWTSIVRCDGLSGYAVDPAFSSAGFIVFGAFLWCTVVSSVSFVHQYQSIRSEYPWQHNRIWSTAMVVAVIAVALLWGLSVDPDSWSAIPWYVYLLMLVVNPLLCVSWDEFWKGKDRHHYEREEKLRRLQFETRLGMWSPK